MDYCFICGGPTTVGHVGGKCPLVDEYGHDGRNEKDGDSDA